MEIEDLFQFTGVSAPRISPDGEKIVFIHTKMDPEEDTYHSHLWMADLETKKNYQFTSSRGKDKNPSWSPDGDQIMFTSTLSDEEKPQLFIIKPSGGEARQITEIKEGVESPRWSPNGETILFLSNVERRDQGESDVKVIDRIVYKFQGKGFFQNKRKHLFSVNVSSGVVKQLTEGEYDVSAPRWSGDGSIIFYSNLEDDADLIRRWYLYKVDAEGGSPEQISHTLMSIMGITSKGETIAYAGHDYHNGSGTISDVWILENNKSRNLTEGFDQDLGTRLSSDIRVKSPNVNPTWHNDYLYFTSCYEGVSSLYRVSENGGQTEKVIGEVDHSVESFSISEDGKIAYTVLKPNDLIEVWLWDGEKTWQVTDLNKSFREKVEILGHRQFTFTSNAGHMVEGWLMKPPGFDASKKYPMILHIHGGPRGAYGNSMNHEFQVLAAQGWAVMYINPWGSGGYNEAYQAGLPGHYHEQDYDDLMRAVDIIIERNPWVDVERLGVTGGSYGGVMTNWIITQTNRFAAAVTLRSISNWMSFYGVSDIGWTFGKTEMGGDWWDNMDTFLEKSPITHVKNVTTPTLIIHSEEDYRCPMEQAEQLFTALKVLGVETEFIRFPEESHELSRSGKPKHRAQRLKHIVRWFKKHLV